MKIYTKTGDNGETSLFDGKRVSKYHPRLKAYGELDLLNVTISECLLECTLMDLTENLEKIQSKIFKLSSLLATERLEFLGDFSSFVADSDVLWLEARMDAMSSGLSPLKNFIVPGGTKLAVLLHRSRVVTRGAERLVIAASLEGDIYNVLVRYLNRLSDYFFVAARWVNMAEGVEDKIIK